MSTSPCICPSITILSGIARDLKWEMDYFDTWIYSKDDDANMKREKFGEFKPAITAQKFQSIPSTNLIPDLQSKIDAIEPDVLAITAMTHEYQYLMSFFPYINSMFLSENLYVN